MRAPYAPPALLSVQRDFAFIVPADLALFDGAVSLDQAALTGESLPVDAGPDKPAYTGSIVRRGEASGAVTAMCTSRRR